MDPETVVSGNTLEDLRGGGHSRGRRRRQHRALNELCAKGCDDDFGVAGSDMAAIDPPPSSASRAMWACRASTPASWWTTATGDRQRGRPIPGLYAAGIQAGNPCGGINWSMPGGFSNSHIFTAGRYTVIHA